MPYVMKCVARFDKIKNTINHVKLNYHQQQGGEHIMLINLLADALTGGGEST